MPKTPRPKIRTIRRRKEWPAEYRWFAVEPSGLGFIYTHRPVLVSRYGFEFWSIDATDPASCFMIVHGRWSTARWRSSLRRIAGKVRG
jgi:hypothetical protein